MGLTVIKTLNGLSAQTGLDGLMVYTANALELIPLFNVSYTRVCGVAFWVKLLNDPDGKMVGASQV